MTTTTTKCRPVLFAGPMVRAILDGRKTMTRRLVDVPMMSPNGCPLREIVPSLLANRGDLWDARYEIDNPKAIRCPLGGVGDHLWLRETWLEGACWYDPARCGPLNPYDPDFAVYYRSDGELAWAKYVGCTRHSGGWRPSIHMPRWASRITLEITGVRVEKLAAITDADAIAEGARRFDDIPLDPWHRDPRTAPRWSMGDPATTGHCMETPRLAFGNYWNKLAGRKDGYWDEGAWVWVIEFRRLEDTP